MCQDVEIVGHKSIPQISIDNFIKIMTKETNRIKEKKVNTEKEKTIEKDVLAIELAPSNEQTQFLILEILKEKEERKSMRQSLVKICPISFSWYLDK